MKTLRISLKVAAQVIIKNDHRKKYFSQTLREKSPNAEFFLVRTFLKYFPKTRKDGPEKTPYLDSFYAVKFQLQYREYSFK